MGNLDFDKLSRYLRRIHTLTSCVGEEQRRAFTRELLCIELEVNEVLVTHGDGSSHRLFHDPVQDGVATRHHIAPSGNDLLVGRDFVGTIRSEGIPTRRDTNDQI